MANLFNHIVIMIIFTITMLSENTSTVQSLPDTGVRYAECSVQTYSESDPYALEVDFALGFMLLDASGRPRYFYLDRGRYVTVYAECQTQLLPDDCEICLWNAYPYLKDNCAYAVGAEVVMVDCRLRYENYPFF